MKLSERLETIASLIPDHVTVYDIGCDHGHLEVYLIQHRVDVTIYAVEKSDITMKKARKTFSYYPSERIIPVVNPVLATLPIAENSYLVLAGLGANTIIKLLKGSRLPEHIIIDARRDLKNLRAYLISLGYQLKKERIVLENEYDYVIMLWERGNASYDEVTLWIGPMILKESHPKKRCYLTRLYERYQKRLLHMPKESEQRMIFVKVLERINEELEKDKATD